MTTSSNGHSVRRAGAGGNISISHASTAYIGHTGRALASSCSRIVPLHGIIALTASSNRYCICWAGGSVVGTTACKVSHSSGALARHSGIVVPLHGIIALTAPSNRHRICWAGTSGSVVGTTACKVSHTSGALARHSGRVVPLHGILAPTASSSHRNCICWASSSSSGCVIATTACNFYHTSRALARHRGRIVPLGDIVTFTTSSNGHSFRRAIPSGGTRYTHVRRRVVLHGGTKAFAASSDRHSVKWAGRRARARHTHVDGRIVPHGGIVAHAVAASCYFDGIRWAGKGGAWSGRTTTRSLASSIPASLVSLLVEAITSSSSTRCPVTSARLTDVEAKGVAG